MNIILPKGNTDDITLGNVTDLLTSILKNQTGRILIGTTGSSGRGEEYAKLDDLELLIYYAESDTNFVDSIKDAIKNFSGACDIVFESKETPFKPIYFEGIPNRLEKPVFFPSRFVDFTVLHGDVDKYNEIIDIFITQCLESSTNERKSWKSRISYHRGISETGKGKFREEEFELYDTKNRTIRYRKTPGSTEVSVKIGALRFIQYTIVQIITKLIRIGLIDREKFKIIGKNIGEKIDSLEEYGLGISYMEISELKSLYNFLLDIHNRMSKEFKKNGEGCIGFSDEEFRIFLENLQRFNELTRKLTIDSKI